MTPAELSAKITDTCRVLQARGGAEADQARQILASLPAMDQAAREALWAKLAPMAARLEPAPEGAGNYANLSHAESLVLEYLTEVYEGFTCAYSAGPGQPKPVEAARVMADEWEGRAPRQSFGDRVRTMTPDEAAATSRAIGDGKPPPPLAVQPKGQP